MARKKKTETEVKSPKVESPVAEVQLDQSEQYNVKIESGEVVDVREYDFPEADIPLTEEEGQYQKLVEEGPTEAVQEELEEINTDVAPEEENVSSESTEPSSDIPDNVSIVHTVLINEGKVN